MQTEPAANNLLRALRPADLALLEPHLEPVLLGGGQVLFEAGDEVLAAHFPCGEALVAFQVVMEDGAAVEAALVGREGAVGGIVSQGRLPAFSRAVVRGAGPFLRISSVKLEAAKNRSPALGHAFTRYADCMLAQVFQSVACNAAHGLEARLAKWLLASRERTGRDEVPVTQEQLAGMLGAGRSYVSRVLGELRGRGVVATRRGRLVIEDPQALSRVSCRCQDQVRRHFEEVLAGVYPTVRESQEMHA